MSIPADSEDRVRGQKHEFILHYYDMAVKDLERHLQVGWQSISFAAGVIAVLSAGQQGYLPIPIAVLIAFGFSFWGMHNIIDADLWARRAIAFLANVESIYFKYEDRRVFNPYAGAHPPFKIFESLKSQLLAVFVFVTATCMFHGWGLIQHVKHYLAAGNHLADITRLKFAFWLTPVFFFWLLVYLSVKMRRDRLSDYLDFVTDSPGPGMVRGLDKWRTVDLKGNFTAADVVAGEEIQKDLREDLQKKLRRWNKLLTWTKVVSLLATVGLILLIALEHYLLMRLPTLQPL